jgi:lipoprotein-anchoring transpeptidase ErfK/SrfK
MPDCARRPAALTAAIVLVMLAIGSPPIHAQTLKAVKERGTLNCGVSQGLLGFSNMDDKNAWTGFDVDICRAVAAAIFGDPEKVTFMPLDTATRFTALQSNKIDVLSRNSTWTMSRESSLVPGSIVIDRENRFLYLIDSNNSARRYGVGIAQECLKGGSFFRVTNKLEWPDLRTSSNTSDADALLAAAGRPGSLLGARALLLDKPGLLIHGTNSPKTIGHLVASGCIRLVNDDIEDLYRRVSLETRVVFVS